ncbi:MAG TPA: hypothetical protein DDW52_26890 [Planctomycetaceae bacterium]|nr:hypothetical protein [Planctomycetaceae bacterium]
MNNAVCLHRVCSPRLLAGLLALAVTSAAAAKPPAIFDIFRKQKVPDGPLELRPEHGPWLVMAAVVTEDEGHSKAVALAKELRETLRIPAFVMKRTSGTPDALGMGERVRTNVLTGEREVKKLKSRFISGGAEEGFAVLVGEFDSIEDPRVEKTLEQIRKLRPKSLLTDQARPDLDDASTNWIVQKYRSSVWNRNNRTSDLGPMGRAFATRNPLLPEEYFLDSPKLDEFVTELNSKVKHSLLKCTGKYTVRVATFTGKDITGFGSNGLTSPEASTKVTSRLDRAALRAHQMTTRLRERGVEAYEFHDKYGSYVTIGSFDSLGTEVDGQFRYNPRMTAVAEKYCGYEVVNAENKITGRIAPINTLKTVDKNPKDTTGRIPFDLQGKPMAVPRPYSSVYGGSLLGGR